MRTRDEVVTEARTVTMYLCELASCTNGPGGGPAETRTITGTGIVIELWDPKHVQMWFDTTAHVAAWAAVELPKMLNPVPAPPPDPVPVGL